MIRTTIAAFTAWIFLGIAIPVVCAPQDGSGKEQRPRGTGRGGRGHEGHRGGPQGGFRTEVPPHPYDLVLARPTKNATTLSVLSYTNAECYIAYGTQPGRCSQKTPTCALKAGQPSEMAVAPLQPNTRYYYQFCSRVQGSATFEKSPEHTFHTQRPPGATFTFTVQADSHLDSNTEPSVYTRTLANALADAPDFHIDLGDTFMTGKYRDDRPAASQQYLAQRYYFGLIGHSAPVFLVLGNHDGEKGERRREEEASVWANMMRKKYFSNPVPDSFYTGNEIKHETAGLLENYYAWEWGDALFVMLDPFWPSSAGGRDSDENWNRTLGLAQYQWLKRTLEQSRAKFRLVFIHHLVGGITPEGRGGSETAPYYEWGGKNRDGSDGFKQNRPGWPLPIHELLARNHVNIVFHGHDHLFAKQEFGGIIYQEVPQPGFPGDGRAPRSAAEYGYVEGTILGSPGHMRITVSPEKVTADYILSCPPGEGTSNRKNRRIACSYTIPKGGAAGAARTNPK
ncbi:MAG TPA: metallophosphoesterase [Verrucomicrobiae bacterium]|nr:metallophosphoesterase [Verrucomicrobiae bacterium]